MLWDRNPGLKTKPGPPNPFPIFDSGHPVQINNEQQWFYARDVMEPVRLITSTSYDVPAFAKHLKAFCEENRGCILERRGPPRKVQYRFVKPLMGPYVVLKGLADGLITEKQLSHSFAFFHCPRATFTATFWRCSGDRALAREPPPFIPPARLLLGTESFFYGSRVNFTWMVVSTSTGSPFSSVG